jgi:hypothetical protein
MIVTSDHGTSFKPDSRARSSRDTVGGETMAVPMFIKLPYQNEGTISDNNTEAIDILPTIADVLDIDLQWTVDGRSVFDESGAGEIRDKKTLVYLNESGGLDRLLVSGKNENRDVRLQHKLSIFGSGRTRPDGYFRIGKHGDLVGKKVAEIPVMEDYADPVTVHFNEQSLFADVDPDNQAFVPVFISGTIIDGIPDDEPVYLAIAINGIIEATTRTFREPSAGPIEFYAMIAERALKKGRNEVSFFVIPTRDESEVRLSPVKIAVQ